MNDLPSLAAAHNFTFQPLTFFFSGCNSHPNFGIEGDRKAVYCAKHKLPGMVNVKAPRCR